MENQRINDHNSLIAIEKYALDVFENDNEGKLIRSTKDQHMDFPEQL